MAVQLHNIYRKIEKKIIFYEFLHKLQLYVINMKIDSILAVIQRSIVCHM